MTDIRYPYLASLKDFEFVTTASLFQKSYFKEAAVKSTQQLVCIEYVHDNNYRSLRNKFEQLTKFQHPFILKVFGFYSPANEEESALVTPFCSFYSLDILQKTGNDMPKNNKYKIVFGICESMKYLEKLHMFHGDLKPSKILIDKNNNPILNFGKFYSQEL